jgi:thiamine pyrophosphokinase
MRLVRKSLRGSGIADIFRKVVEPLKEKYEQTKKTVNALFNLTDFNKAFREVLERYGNVPIKIIKVCRSPVSSAVQSAMDVVSLGAFKKRLGRAPYDEIFHLFALITLEDNTVLTLDKQSQLTLKVGSKSYQDSIDVSPPFSTISEMLNNTRKSMGDTLFFGYNAKSNNCQVFLYKFFESNGKATPQLRDFIMQDVSTLFDDSLEYFSNFVTHLGSKVSTLQYGGDV